MTDQSPTLTAEQMLARLQRAQAEVDEAQAAYDAANEKSRKASDVAGRAYRALESAQERRDEAHRDLIAALPAPTPESEDCPVDEVSA